MRRRKVKPKKKDAVLERAIRELRKKFPGLRIIRGAGQVKW